MRKVNPEYAKAIMAIANRAPYLKLLGMKICELDYGYCRVETQINDSLNNPFASVHGGVFSSILDTATFWALYCCIGEEDGITTLDLQVNNLAAAASGKIIAEGRLIRMGRTIGLADVLHTAGQFFLKYQPSNSEIDEMLQMQGDNDRDFMTITTDGGFIHGPVR